MARKEKPVKEPKQPKPKKEKPAKAPKPKKEKPAKAPAPKKEPKEKKPGMMDRFRKNKTGEDEGFDIMAEVKEPFSLSGWFDTHVVEKLKRAKQILSDHGILFFFTSPFMARSRLIAQLIILFLGVMFGVIPRASSMVHELQDQAYQSEIYGLQQKTVGSITITPAASSNYKKMHMIAFVVDGKNLPSDPSKYDVHLARGYGASDWEDVTYSWSMYPVKNGQRILLVAIDQSKQASGYGAFQLYIQKQGDEVSEYARQPFEITLSTAQPTTELYDKTGVHLSALTEAICGSGEIGKKQVEFEEALAEYQVAVEQAEAMPVEGIKVAPTVDDLEAYCLSKRIYRALKDDSNTEDILDIEMIPDYQSSLANDDLPETIITCKGVDAGNYDAAFKASLESDEGVTLTDEQKRIMTEWENLDTAKKAVLAAMDNVNTAADSWYQTLDANKLILNQTIKTGSFPLYARVTNTIDDDINFLEGSPEGPDEKDPGMHGTMIGDDPYPDKNKGEEDPEPLEEPSQTEQPAEEPVKETYTVTYKDGADGEAFEDQVHEDVEEGSDTPAFDGTPERDGYEFAGWDVDVEDTVTGNAVYTATWEQEEDEEEEPAKPESTYKPGTMQSGDPADSK